MRFTQPRLLAPFATRPENSRGRALPEASSPTRSDFQRDRDRILHSNAFRRLKHKTQVFIAHEGDHYRTRLTHTLEVAQIARALARLLGLEEDLAETLALAHDLGHPPFGHAGEDALDVCMAPYGGFEHNAQTLRIVTTLEHRYAAFDGLNLTFETLQGLVKHNGPLRNAAGEALPPYAQRGIPASLVALDARYNLALDRFASAEAQVAALADDIAYTAHDVDDGLRAGLLTPELLRDVPFLRAMLDEIFTLWPQLAGGRIAHEITRRVITRLIEDAALESENRLAALAPPDVAAIEAHAAPVIAFSPAMAAHLRDTKAFLFKTVYRHPRVMPLRRAADRVVRALFAHYSAHPHQVPGACEAADTPRAICDYLAGMTDGFAIAEHRRAFGHAPDFTLSPG